MNEKITTILYTLAGLRDEGERLELFVFTQLLDMAIEELCENFDDDEIPNENDRTYSGYIVG